MTWQDRLKPAAYTSPSGIRLVFDYENVSKSISKKTSAFEFPDANGTYVQDLGHTGRKYALRMFFWGDDHDLLSNQLETMLLEKGTGILEHPIYGTIDVVPFGNIKFKNELKTNANQTIIEVTFWETIDLIYPIDQKNPSTEVLASISEYNVVSAESFETYIDIDSEVEVVSLKNEYENLLSNVEATTKTIRSEQEDVQKQFDAVHDSINNGIDVLIKEPLTLAFQTTILIQTPARSIASISDRLSAYNNLLQSIITSGESILTPSNDSRNANAFHTRDLYASTYITGSVLSAVNNQFITKIDALETAEMIANQLYDLTTWRDANFNSLSVIDTGEAYQQLQTTVALTVGFLVEISFSLKQERSIVLESPRTMIDLISELYPPDTVIDDELDFFIQSNDLTGSEILELPRGREIVYYV